MKSSFIKRCEIITELTNNTINKYQAAELLNCTPKTIENYQARYKKSGATGLVDHRHSNFLRLSDFDKNRITNLKRADPWRSARNIRDKLNLPIHEMTVWRVFKKEGLTKQNTPRVKPLQRFEAQRPNDLWQTDIMGKISFPRLGTLYLIATVDDHSRFCLAGQWFTSQNKVNVFLIWYQALSRWGYPKSILQDAGSQYKARARFGLADYQWYAKSLGIELIWAKRAQTKGKIERFWRFVQTDFVPEVWQETSIEKVNKAFSQWLKKYNYDFKSRAFANKTRFSRYKTTSPAIDHLKLRTILTIEERRKVSRESTISLYGKYYVVPSKFIGRSIWVKIIGNKLIFEANGHLLWKAKLDNF